MFKVGDLVLYGCNGVCKINDITAIEFDKSSKKRLYYVLKPVYQECTISTPVEHNQIPMRPIITLEEAEHIISKIPHVKAEMYHSSVLRELTEHYDVFMNTYECKELMELCMSIYNKRQILQEENKKQGATDERYLKQAEDLLFGELAIVFGVQPSEVPALISNRLQEDWQNFCS